MKPALSAAAALVLSATLAAQTAIKPPKNKYKPEDDVKLGREAAAEVRVEPAAGQARKARQGPKARAGLAAPS